MVNELLLPLFAKVDVLPVRPPILVKPRKGYSIPFGARRAAYELWDRNTLNLTLVVPLL